MKNAKLPVVLALGVLVVAGAAFSAALAGNVANAQGDRLNMHDRINATVNERGRGMAIGVLSSVQTDPSGGEWLVYGPWKMFLIPSADDSESPDMRFTAAFTMVMKDGTAKHRHQIYDFDLTEWTADETTATFEGTATITQRDGPVEDVPVTIKIINDSVAEISIDTSVIDHFGESPIYGIVLRSRL